MIWDKIKEKMNETFKSNVDNEKQDETIEKSDKKELERKKPHLTVPIHLFIHTNFYISNYHIAF